MSDDTDKIKELLDVFVSQVFKPRIQEGQCPILRPVFQKTQGCAFGTFTINPDLPPNLRIGIFSYSSFAACLRFSVDGELRAPDFMNSLGVGIKLFAVPGQKLLPGEETCQTHDFVLKNVDIFVLDTLDELVEFTYANYDQARFDKYVRDHPELLDRLKETLRPESSLLRAVYWSVFPYAFGLGRYVKYSLRPRDGAPASSSPAAPSPPRNPNYLRDDLKQRLLDSGAEFEFCVQFQGDPVAMPLDRPTVRWSEVDSKPVLVARLTLPAGQDIDHLGTQAYGENLAFNPWRVLAEHRPVGSLAEVRRVLYPASAGIRRPLNGVPLAEPSGPNPIVDL